MPFPTHLLPKRYHSDEDGNRVLVGLSIEETFEFETLDEIAPFDENGNLAWQEGLPITNRERRWLELYQKHQAAWRDLIARQVANKS